MQGYQQSYRQEESGLEYLKCWKKPKQSHKPRILYAVKLSFTCEWRRIKIFSDKIWGIHCQETTSTRNVKSFFLGKRKLYMLEAQHLIKKGWMLEKKALWFSLVLINLKEMFIVAWLLNNCPLHHLNY